MTVKPDPKLVLVKGALEKARQAFGPQFPMLGFKPPVAPIPAWRHGALSDHLHTFYDVHIFYKLSVRPNPLRSFNSKPYVLHVEPPEFVFKVSYCCSCT